MRALRWRFLVTEGATGAWNMAVDEALMAHAAASGDAVLRVYSWSERTLSLGRNQPARGAYDLDRARALGVEFVRRPTGGRALLHHREVTYSVTAPTDALGALTESYGRINRLVVEGLRALGVRASVASGAGMAPPPSLAPCFEEPVRGEIVADGRKLVGSAQWRHDGALLQHGSILVDDDQSLAVELLRPRVSPPPPPATLAELLGAAPPMANVADCLTAALRATEDADARPLVLDGPLKARVRTLTYRYQDPEWTWRR